MGLFRKREPLRLVFDEVGVRKVRGETPVEAVEWSSLQGVDIWTTDDGPFAEDMFWVLIGPGDTGVVVPAGLAPADFLPRLQGLPGFKNAAVIEASGSAHPATFECWRREDAAPAEDVTAKTAVLPTFAYHPAPLQTGSIVESPETCECCEEARGYVYRGPIAAVDEIEFVCPWCIADGRAAEMFEAEFTTADGAPSDLGADVLDELLLRTPGFAGWQQERWLYHCGDAAEFHGQVGWDRVAAIPGAIEMLAADGWPQDILPSMAEDGDLTGYLFRCRHCAAELVYADAS